MILNKRKKSLDKTGILILLSGILILIITVFIFNRPAFYDEDDYLQNVAIIHQLGFGKQYLLHLIGSAGPLYSIVHYLLEPLTHLQMPYLRLVNIAFLFGIIILVGRSLRLLQFSEARYAMIIMAIPMTYVITGLALTEIPAMFFLSAGIYLMIRSIDETINYYQAICYAMTSGICLSLAIIGRQPYLVILAGLPIFYFSKRQPAKNITLLLVTLSFSLALPCYIFWIWKGLVAPSDSLFYSDIASKGVNYRPELFLLCLAYYAIVFLIIAPEIYSIPSKKQFAVIFTCIVFISMLNDQLDLIRFLPLKAGMEKILPVKFVDSTEKLAGSFLAIIGLYLLFVLIGQLQKANYKKELFFYVIAMTAVAFSCIKITGGFSSRYAAQAIPLIVPLAAYFKKNNPYSNWRLAAGVVVGIVSLLMFFLS